MEGRAHAATNAFELSMSQAWHTEAFAREKRLKSLGKYLAASKPQQPQAGAEMLATLREIKARGAPMTIRRVEA
jgi:protoporphyrinogen oxidase